MKWTVPGAFVGLALGMLSLANQAQRSHFGAPDDGVVWVDADAGVEAARVDPQGPAARVGVRPGDVLLSIGGRAMDEALDATRALAAVGVWNRVEYVFSRGGAELAGSVIVGESSGQPAVRYFLTALGWIYGLIGFAVYWRKGGKQAARFYAFCLASFALYSLSFSGALDGLDRLVYWLDVWALLLAPAIFLDFCLRFPHDERRPARAAKLSYGLAASIGVGHHLTASGWLVADGSAAEELFVFDSLPLILMGLNFVAGAVAVWRGARAEEELPLRQQRRWLAYGALGAALPFCAFYAAPFVLGYDPGPNAAFAVFSLALLPLAAAFALVKYRLMDVELFARRSSAYGLAAAVLMTAFYTGSLLAGGLFETGPRALAPVAWLVSLVAAAVLFHPLRNRIQQALDRRFYRERYDYRRTLTDFAAELTRASDLQEMVAAVCGRLTQTLDVERLAVFVADADAERSAGLFRLLRQHGLESFPTGGLARLSLLEGLSEKASGTVFFESPKARSERSDGLRELLAALDCNYFVPCRARGRTTAWLALGRTNAGRYLSGDDAALVETAAGYFAIALENARLYRSLERKAEQYQQLKDYNENIVESLSVGILAANLDDRVESWNTQLELVFGISRPQAAGRKLEELLPPALIAEFEKCRGETGIRNVYKFRLRAGDFPAEFRPSDASVERERLVNIAIAPLVAKDFQPIGRLVIFDDVTERVELEEQVAQADKLSSIGLLAAGVAHEVNTPLAVISSYAQMLAKRIEQDSSEAEMLGKITAQTFRAGEIVHSLLNFSRTAGSETAPTNVNRVLEDMLVLVAPQLRKAGVRVEKRLAAAIPVQANAGKLQQVFLNLFLNARDAMPHGGTLAVETRESGGGHGVEIRIADTGVGISEAAQRRIFDPFFTTKGPQRGTGLGLAVTYGIVQEHSGVIGVDSAPGRGTTFTIALPAAEQAVHA